MKKLLLLCLPAILFLAFKPKEIKWVAIGDSITYLNDHQNETGNRITKGYMTMAAEKMPELKYTNKGYNGWTATRIAADIEKLELEPADLYTVFLGTNDWWGSKPLGSLDDYTNNTGAATIHGAFRIIINKLRSLNKNAAIVLITPMQRVDFVYINNYKNNAWGSYRDKNGLQLEQVADAMSAIGEREGIPVVDLYHERKMNHRKLVHFKRLKDPSTGQYKDYRYPAFIDIPFDPQKDEYPYPKDAIKMTYDGLHPSDKGYAFITSKLLAVFKKINFQQ
jgi:lysophospholipase L1-like esterase